MYVAAFNRSYDYRSVCLNLQLMIKDHIIHRPDPLEAQEVPQMPVPEHSGSAPVGLSRIVLRRSGWAPVRLGTEELSKLERSSFNLSEIKLRNLLGCGAAAAYPKG